MSIVAAVDGSALSNPGPAGWCWYIDDNTWAAGGWKEGTNNRGELMAVEQLLRSTAHISDTPLHILCDSQYVINSVTKWMPGWKKKGWKKRDGKPVLNVDILKAIDQLLVGRPVKFEWVKGHAGHELNEAADLRARAASTAYRDGLSVPHGPGFPGATPETAIGAPTPAQRAVTGAEQCGLFEIGEEADKRVDKRRTAERAFGLLQRAVRRAYSGDAGRLEFLVKDALLVPENLEAAFPQGYADATASWNILGDTAVALVHTKSGDALSVWDLKDRKLVAHQLSR